MIMFMFGSLFAVLLSAAWVWFFDRPRIITEYSQEGDRYWVSRDGEYLHLSIFKDRPYCWGATAVSSGKACFLSMEQAREAVREVNKKEIQLDNSVTIYEQDSRATRLRKATSRWLNKGVEMA